MLVTTFVQLRSNKVSNVPTIRGMQHELHSLIDERNLVWHVNDGLTFHVLQLTVDASIQRWVAHGTINLQFIEGLLMYQQFNIQQLYALPTLYLCVLYLSENKQRLVPLTA